MTTPPTPHKAGCPALGGYGHGKEVCICGATPASVQGLADWLRNMANNPWHGSETLAGWASAVESLEASRIEGQAHHIVDANKKVGGVPPGEWGGLSPKQAWWAGYRVGKGLPPETPRSEAVAAEAVPALAEPDLHAAIMNLPCNVPAGYPFGSELCVGVYRQGHRDARHAAAELVGARKDRGDALLLKVYQHLERFAADSDIIDEVRDYLEGK